MLAPTLTFSLALSLPDPQLPGDPRDALQSIQRNFDALAQADQGARIRAGEETLSFSAAATATADIAHGLGKAPTIVVATADRNEGAGDLWNVTVGNFDGVEFTVEVSNIAGSTGTSAKVYWVAIAL